MPAKNSVVVQCHWCGNSLSRQMYRVKKTKIHFCNSKCRGNWLKTQTGINAYAYKGTNVTVNCSQCGKEVVRDPSKIKRNENFFCGQGCWNKWRSIRMRGANNRNWVEPIHTYCSTCNKPIDRDRSRVGVTERKFHFCCKQCKHQWMSESRSGENSPIWKGGSIRYYGPTWHKQSRAARKRDNYHCRVCGKSQKKNGKALDVHHIIPFKSFGYKPGKNENHADANALTNLVSLCRNCHVKAESGKVAIQLNLL